MNPVYTSFVSQSHYMLDFWADVKWQLQDYELKRTSKKYKEAVFEYKNIEAVRLCYHMGSRSSPAAYYLYFKYNKKWRNKQIFSSASTNTDEEAYHQYHHFVHQLLLRIKTYNSLLPIYIGHSAVLLSFYLLSCFILLGIAPITYAYNIITLQECTWAFIILLILTLPIIKSMIKYFPQVIYLTQDIPLNVLPQPTHYA